MGFISNALKNLFNLLGQKTPTNNGVTSSDLVPLLNSSHAPKGDVSITDLASVLGAVACFANATNPDSITQAGLYQSNSWDTTKAPEEAGVLIVPFFNSSYWKFQLFMGNTSEDLYYRRGSSSAYTSWKRLPSE